VISVSPANIAKSCSSHISFKLCVSRNVYIRIVSVSSESDCSGAAFDHDVAAGAAICSPCQAGTYFSGSGRTPLSKKRGARMTNRPLLSAGECIARCQDGNGEQNAHNVTVRGAAVPGPEPLYTPCGGCACRWPGIAWPQADASKAACSR
jgi:hypothetical protein